MLNSLWIEIMFGGCTKIGGSYKSCEYLKKCFITFSMTVNLSIVDISDQNLFPFLIEKLYFPIKKKPTTTNTKNVSVNA